MDQRTRSRHPGWLSRASASALLDQVDSPLRSHDERGGRRTVSSVGGIGTAVATGSNDVTPNAPLEQPVGTPRRFPCFDGLRAIAVVSVLLLHTAWVSGFTERNSLGVYTSRLEIGVSIFFLVSG